MTTGNVNSYKLGFEKAAIPVRINQLKFGFGKLASVYDTNKDNKLDADEILVIRKEVYRSAYYNNGKVSNSDISRIAKELNTDNKTLVEFWHDLNGAIIGNNLYKCLNRFKYTMSTPVVVDIKKYGNSINKKNVETVCSSFTSNGMHASLINVLYSQLAKTVSIPIIENIVESSVEACKDKKIDVSADYAKFKEAVKNDNDDEIKRYANIISQKLRFGESFY